MSHFKISIVAKNYWSANFLRVQMDEIFGNLFEITTHSPDTDPIVPIRDSDMILLHEPSVLEDMYKYIKCDCPTLLMKRTISANALEELLKIPENSTAVVVNLNDYMARETLINIYQLGLKKIKMSTWSPEKGSFPKTDYIITPRIYDFLPECDTPKIILGSRILDIDMIMEILSYFKVDLPTVEDIVKLHMTRTPSFFHGSNYMLENNRLLYTQLDSIFNKSHKSVAVVDSNNIIRYVNSTFAEYLGVQLRNILNDSLENLATLYKPLKLVTYKKEITNELIEIDNQKIILNTNNLYDKTNYMGKVITLEHYNPIQVCRKSGGGNVAKYTFDDLIGSDRLFQKSIKLGKKASNSTLPVLIYGESGTGKELMASAIHNNSDRREKPFVAVNCGSISSELFESELFGYEEGAFTGSKRGGSTGLFEKANGGTIFLDEISEIPYNLQSRLLRVLQEQEIRKVGANYNTSIDVRIISASNKDLYELTKQNLFRKDLYYRINVFRITMPPLRKRKSDIEILVKHFLGKDLGKVEPEFFTFIKEYPWPGNVRELKNAIEFASTVAESDIGICNLPDYLKDEKFFKDIQIDKDISLTELLMIKLILNCTKENISTSRNSLCEYFSDLYFEISEVKTRKILSLLEEKGYITIPRGRSGCQLTSKSCKLLGVELLKI